MTPEETTAYRAKRTIQAKARYHADPEKGRAAAKSYRAKNPGKVRASYQKWLAANKESEKLRGAQYRAANPEKRKATTSAWKAKNADHLKAYEATRCKTHAAEFRAKANKRRALKRSSPGQHTAKDVQEIMSLQKSTCPVCRASLKKGYHVDHIVALSKGGANDRLNIQLLCPRCNLQKHDKDPISFMQEKGFLL